MRIMSLVIALVAATAFAALGQEETVEDIKQGAKKAAEKIKEGAETVGEKTKEAAKTVAKETKKAWRETKAYASGDRTTYRKGARQKLNALSKEIADLKSQRSEATDPQTFDSQLDTLTQQQATAKEQLATMKEATNAKDYDDARKQFDKTIGEMEDGIAQARKQLRD
jgi:trehalose-6-phosphate synthase